LVPVLVTSTPTQNESPDPLSTGFFTVTPSLVTGKISLPLLETVGGGVGDVEAPLGVVGGCEIPPDVGTAACDPPLLHPVTTKVADSAIATHSNVMSRLPARREVWVLFVTFTVLVAEATEHTVDEVAGRTGCRLHQGGDRRAVVHEHWTCVVAVVSLIDAAAWIAGLVLAELDFHPLG